MLRIEEAEKKIIFFALLKGDPTIFVATVPVDAGLPAGELSEDAVPDLRFFFSRGLGGCGA
jgi:hypothetical protein